MNGENLTEMKQIFIEDLKKDMEFTDFFMIRSVTVKTGSNNKQYLDLILSDMTGDMVSKKWDVSDDELSSLKNMTEGSIVKVKGIVTEWNGVGQLRIQRIRLKSDVDELDIKDFINAAPEPSKDMYEYILASAKAIQDEDLKKLCLCLLEKNEEKLMYYPAARKNHHAQMGGLLYHMKRMLMTGERVCEVYTNLNRDLVITGVIIHDIEKLNEILSDEYGISPGYSFEGKLLGHIIQGIKVIDKITLDMGFPREKAIMLEHMILSHHYEPEFGSPKKPLFPEAEILHYLDMIDARMFDMEQALKNIDPGSFSERVFTLDNRQLYKPEDK
ncbi:MAG: HD domain-containing protein [Eubacteriales bacterium]|nr:HD domain-containing protein [Eubacteriales bacterium]MDD4389582.1 HD domain-containing protein [Eubacteriales bacterium]